jgi:hypothetical protein
MDPNKMHFRAKALSSGVQWELYFPINDPWMNICNPEQSASQRANTDCKPLVGHYSAIQYVCKYATKLETASHTFDTSMARAFTGYKKPGDPNVDEDAPKSASSVYASFLIQQDGSRNWSSQEVAHVLMGIPSTISSHRFRCFSTSGWSKVKKYSSSIDEEEFDGGSALEKNAWEKYLNRASTLANMVDGEDTTVRTLGGELPMDQQRSVPYAP